MKLSLTEVPNYLTQNIDIATPLQMIRLFRQVDSQMFQGYKEYPGFQDPEFQNKFQEALHEISRSLKKYKKVTIVFSGAGTSGRLAGFLSKSFRRITSHISDPKPSFEYLMAGGKEALVAAKEGAEDDPFQAVKDLQQFEKKSDRIIYIGITCGFSAPYIAGQMNYTADHPLYYSILVGFNPSERARNVTIENWDKNFSQVLLAFEKGSNTCVLNPIVGPEAITGSTRLKGGSATKIIGEMLIGLSLLHSGILKEEACLDPEFSLESSFSEQYLHILGRYRQVKYIVYNHFHTIERFIQTSGNSLNHGGHIYYLGKGNLGNIGTIDASECPPTFGAHFADVRGFVENGWPGLLEEDTDMSHVDWMYRISLEDFDTDVFPTLTKRDTIFILGEKGDEAFIKSQLDKLKNCNAQVQLIYFSPSLPEDFGISSDKRLHLPIPYPGLFDKYHFWNELALKFTVNIITTGAHILKGKIYRNRMIDLNISNNKLFYRTISIIQTFLGTDYQTALEAILCSIYQTDNLTAEILNYPISRHIQNAQGQNKVVPRALLIATGKFTCKTASKELEKDPIVRNIIQHLVKQD